MRIGFMVGSLLLSNCRKPAANKLRERTKNPRANSIICAGKANFEQNPAGGTLLQTPARQGALATSEEPWRPTIELKQRPIMFSESFLENN
jgi:hypothetical protein